MICPGDYHYESAGRIARERRSRASRRYKLDDDSPGSVGQAVRRGLLDRWSPEQIAGRLRRDRPRDPATRVLPETVYR